METVANLILRNLTHLTRPIPCCMCGRLVPQTYAYGVHLDDEQDESEVMCLPCASEHWYDNLKPDGWNELQHLLHYVLHAQFFRDGMIVRYLPASRYGLEPKTYYAKIEEILCLAEGKKVCIIFPVLSDSFRGGQHATLIDIQEPYYWFLAGQLQDIYSFILAMRWTHYRLPRPAQLTCRLFSVKTEGPFERFETAILLDRDESSFIKFVHYGDLQARYYALGGAAFSLQTRGAAKTIVHMPFFNVSPHPVPRSNLARELKKVLE